MTTDQVLIIVGFFAVMWGLALWSITHRKVEKPYG
jgi:hypothetical protein